MFTVVVLLILIIILSEGGIGGPLLSLGLHFHDSLNVIEGHFGYFKSAMRLRINCVPNVIGQLVHVYHWVSLFGV